jgi:hypothetical protein
MVLFLRVVLTTSSSKKAWQKDSHYGIRFDLHRSENQPVSKEKRRLSLIQHLMFILSNLRLLSISAQTMTWVRFSLQAEEQSHVKYRIRSATSDDSKQLVALVEQLGYPADERFIGDQFERFPSQAGTTVFVADAEGAGRLGPREGAPQILSRL